MRGNLTEANSSRFPSFLPLHIFDNTEYDCRNPKEWLELGLIDGKQHPVPGKALLPKDNGENRIEFDWIDVGALDYDMNKQLFLVQVVGTGGLQHNVIPATNGAVENGIVNGDASHEEPKKKHFKSEAQQAWVPRIQILFAAECPVNFAERVAKAYALRCETEALLRYNLYIDCMPMDGVVRLDPSSLERMITWAKGTRTLRNDKRLGACLITLYSMHHGGNNITLVIFMIISKATCIVWNPYFLPKSFRIFKNSLYNNFMYMKDPCKIVLSYPNALKFHILL